MPATDGSIQAFILPILCCRRAALVSDKKYMNGIIMKIKEHVASIAIVSIVASFFVGGFCGYYISFESKTGDSSDLVNIPAPTRGFDSLNTRAPSGEFHMIGVIKEIKDGYIIVKYFDSEREKKVIVGPDTEITRENPYAPNMAMFARSEDDTVETLKFSDLKFKSNVSVLSDEDMENKEEFHASKIYVFPE